MCDPRRYFECPLSGAVIMWHYELGIGDSRKATIAESETSSFGTVEKMRMVVQDVRIINDLMIIMGDEGIFCGVE